MKVFFIGAGPGAQDLITVRGAEILQRVSFVMYAGSLVPPEVLRYCKPDAQIIDTAKLDLEQQEACYRDGAGPRCRCGTGSFGRSSDLWRYRRADAAPG